MTFGFRIFALDYHKLLKDGLCKCFGLKGTRKHILYTLEDYYVQPCLYLSHLKYLHHLQISSQIVFENSTYLHLLIAQSLGHSKWLKTQTTDPILIAWIKLIKFLSLDLGKLYYLY